MQPDMRGDLGCKKHEQKRTAGPTKDSRLAPSRKGRDLQGCPSYKLKRFFFAMCQATFFKTSRVIPSTSDQKRVPKHMV